MYHYHLIEQFQYLMNHSKKDDIYYDRDHQYVQDNYQIDSKLVWYNYYLIDTIEVLMEMSISFDLLDMV